MSLPSRVYSERWVSQNMKRWQLIDDVLTRPERFKVLATGRQVGKTQAILRWIHDGMVPHGVYWIVEPFRVQAKRMIWPRVKRIAAAAGLTERNVSESDLVVTWPNGATIQLHGADHPASMAGDSIDRVAIDEFRWWGRPDIWEENIRPMLTHSKGPALFASSTHGKDHHYDAYMRGQDPDQRDWWSCMLKTIDSPFVDPAEVEAARRDMDPILFAQEYEASFDTGGDRCAWNFRHDLHIAELADRPRPDQSWIGLDFNISPMIAEVGGYTMHEGRRVVWYYDEVVIPADANTDMMCRILRERFPDIRTVYPDPTGKAGNTASIKSDHRILHDYGFRVLAHPPGRPTHKERLASWNRMLLDGEGRVHMYFSRRCKRLIEDQDKAERLSDGHINKRKYDPHALDAAGYAIEYQHPVTYRNVTARRSA